MTARSRRPLLVLIVLAAVALLAWLWPRAEDETSRGQAARGDATDQRPRGRADGDRQGPGAGASGLAFQRPHASISGTITTAGGGPLPGASVCAWLEHRDLPSALKHEPRCTTSSKDGHYRLADLPPVDVTVGASAPEHVPATWEEQPRRPRIRLQPGQERTGVDLSLEPGGVEVQGIVRDIAGGVVEGAFVTVTTRQSTRWTPGAPRGVTRTDAEGRFSTWAAAGDVFVEASAEGYSSASRSGVAPGFTFELFMTPESVLVGRVVLAETGAAVANAVVSASTSGWGPKAVSDADGRFRIERLQPDTYHPSASTDTAYGRSRQAVHVGLAQTSDEVVVELHPAAMVSGIVLGEGSPCVDGGVQLTRSALSAWGSTDGDGTVTIRAIRPGTYDVSVHCEGHVDAEFEPLVVDTAPVEGQRWELSRGATVRGTVVDEHGDAVADVSLWAAAMLEGRAGTQQYASAKSDANGEFELEGLAPGRYGVRAEAHGHLELPEPVKVEVSERGADPVQIVLQVGGSIEGSVVDARGEPVAGARVRVSNSTWKTQATARDDGTFRIEGIKPGDHRVTASRGWNEDLRAPGETDDSVRGAPVHVVAGEVATVDLVVESQDGRITGRVLDAAGGPISDAFVSYRRESDSAAAAAGRGRQSVRWGLWGREPVLTNDDGAFALEELPPGTYTLRAYRKGGGEAIVEQVEVGSSGVELRMEDTGSISGRVTLAGGGFPDEFRVTLRDKTTGYSQADEFYKTDGEFAMTELPAGDFEVVVSSERGDAKTTVRLEGGEEHTGLAIELTPKVRARGRVVDLDSGEPVSGMRVSISTKGGGFSFNFGGKADETVTDDDGRFEVADAPSGRVQLMVIPRTFTDENYAWSSMFRDIPSDVDEYDLGEIHAIKERRKRSDDEGDLGYKVQEVPPGVEREDFPHRVAFVRPNGPADMVGLKVGDVIESVDGHDVTGLDTNRYSALTNVPPGTTLTLGLADGRSLSVTAGAPP